MDNDKLKIRFSLKAAGRATGIGLLVAGGAVLLFIVVKSAWIETLFNLGTGIVAGVLYSIFADRHGANLEIGQAVGGGALCAVLPTLVVWTVILDVPGVLLLDSRGALLGGILAPALGAIGAAVNEMRT